MIRGIVVKKFGGIENLKIDKFKLPPIGDNQILIKVQASGVNPVDTYIRQGAYAVIPQLPYVPGKDGSGIVENTGSLIKNVKPGDSVFCCLKTARYGTLAEYCIAEDCEVFPFNDNLNFNEAASVGIPYFTAYHALNHLAKVRKNERVFIHGASGGVGLAAVQIARSLGLYVAGTAGTPEGMNKVKEMGASIVYNHRKQGYMREIIGGEEDKFDVILEMASHLNLEKDCDIARKRGRIIVIGCRGSVKFNPRSLMLPEISVIGCALFSSSADEWHDMRSAILDGVKQGWLKPAISKVYSMDEVQQVHHDIIHSAGSTGNLVVKIH